MTKTELQSLAICQQIDLIVGLEGNLYFDSLLPRSINEEWEPAITCELGQHRADRWTLGPEEAQIGQHPFRLEVRDPRDGQGYIFRSEIHVHAQGQNMSPQRWLPIGDSITASGIYVEEALKTGPSFGLPLQSLGTRRNESSSSAWHEGYPGWKYLDFLRTRPATPGPNFREEIAPPFLAAGSSGEILDFGNYLDTHLQGQEPDFITLFLGANDIALVDDSNLETEIPQILEHAVDLVSALLNDSSQTHIGLIPPLPPSASQDAFGINYRCQIPRWRYRKNQHALLRGLQIRFEGFHPRLSILPAFLNIDPGSGYPTRSEPLNARTEETRLVASNSVHPSLTGHRQIADAILAWMAGRLAG